MSVFRVHMEANRPESLAIELERIGAERGEHLLAALDAYSVGDSAAFEIAKGAADHCLERRTIAQNILNIVTRTPDLSGVHFPNKSIQ